MSYGNNASNFDNMKNGQNTRGLRAGIRRRLRSNAHAMRPKIVGEALQKISKDREVSDAMFKILEIENLLDGESRLTLLPKDNDLIKQLVGAESIDDS